MASYQVHNNTQCLGQIKILPDTLHAHIITILRGDNIIIRQRNTKGIQVIKWDTSQDLPTQTVFAGMIPKKNGDK